MVRSSARRTSLGQAPGLTVPPIGSLPVREGYLAGAHKAKAIGPVIARATTGADGGQARSRRRSPCERADRRIERRNPIPKCGVT